MSTPPPRELLLEALAVVGTFVAAVTDPALSAAADEQVASYAADHPGEVSVAGLAALAALILHLGGESGTRDPASFLALVRARLESR